MSLYHLWVWSLVWRLGVCRRKNLNEWWEKAQIRVNSPCSCACLSLIQLKGLGLGLGLTLTLMLLGLGLTLTLNILFPGTNNTLSRCGSFLADHTICFFSFPKLAEFWSYFFKSFSQALCIPRTQPHDSSFGVPLIPVSFSKKHTDVVALASVFCYTQKAQIHPLPHPSCLI